jgi:Cu(I)/Ag(I) efflux system protein CusF
VAETDRDGLNACARPNANPEFLELPMTRLSPLVNTLILSAGLAMVTANATAQMQMQEHGQHGAMQAASQDDPAALSQGEVKKVDKDTGKLTVKHGPLNNLNMPGMTMTFKVQDPAMLDQLKVGDQIRFRVESLNGTYTVTKLEMAK